MIYRPVPGKYLGKRAPQIDKRTLRLANYTPNLPAPPDHVNWLSKVPSWPMYANNILGDCVEAAQGHMEQQWLAYANPTIEPPSNIDIINLYSAEGGYVIGDPSTDNGTDMLTALNYWRAETKKIQAYATVNPQNPTEVKQSVQHFGNCFLGLQLPISAQGENVWQVPVGGPFGLGSRGSWGGHCVPIVSYDRTGLIAITWGKPLFMTWGFLNCYSDEAYAVYSSTDWIEPNGKSPAGEIAAQLLKDMSGL